MADQITGSLRANRSGLAATVGFATVVNNKEANPLILPTTPTVSIGNNVTGITGTQSTLGSPASLHVLQNISMGSLTSANSDGTFGKHMQVGASKNITDGYTSQPSLQLDTVGFWRFRWVVKNGSRTISIRANQNSTGSLYRPSMVIKANPSIGIPSDITYIAPATAGWVTIGPASFTATGTDVVWVELHNNNNQTNDTPVLFDHIVVT